MDELDKLIRILRDSKLSVRVGILGEDVTRAAAGGVGGTPTNAEIGAKHEFGAGNLPRRSWLRMPLETHLAKTLASAKINEDALKKSLSEGTLVPLAKKIAVAAEDTIQEGFSTGGFGQWAAHAPGYENNTGQILVDTQQMRNSVRSEVKE